MSAAVPRPMEEAWAPLVEALAAMLTLAPEYVVLQAYTAHDGECGPYVQTLREEDGALTLEAVSNGFLSVPLGPDSLATLRELGWSDPAADDGLPNHTMFLEPDQVQPGAVAELLVRTLRDAYLVVVTDRFECAPQELFAEVLRGEFGVAPGLRFLPADLAD